MESEEQTQTETTAAPPPEEEQRSCPVRAGRWILAKVLNFSYLIPAAICLLIGGAISFRWALLASSVMSLLSVAVAYALFKYTSPDSEFNPKVFPKLFDVFNPFFFAVLTPVGWWRGFVISLSTRLPL